MLVNAPKEEDKQRKRNPDNISYWDDGNEDIGEELNNPYIYDIVVKSLP
ncbi:hypothetical protein IJL65_04935 [bacterium]|nr:hypothetical protein [bacterium]